MNSYPKVSKEVGFIGYLPYPSQMKAQHLLDRLRSEPQMEDFKQVLSYYRFAPAAENESELKVIYTIEKALEVGRSQLFDDSPYVAEKTTFKEIISRIWIFNRFKTLSFK